MVGLRVVAVAAALAACGGGGKQPAGAGAGTDGSAGSAAVAKPAPGSGSAAKPVAAPVAKPPPAFERPGPADPIVDLFGECATHASGRVDCWDSADSHVQPVDGVADALAMREPPSKSSAELCLIRKTGVDCGDRKFPGVRDAIDIVSGTPTCVLRKSGVVLCRSDDHPKPSPIAKLTDSIALASNGLVTCAVRAGGTVMCAPAGDPLHFRAVKGLAKVHALALAHLANDDSVACALLADGNLRCYDLVGRGAAAHARSDKKQPALDRSLFQGATALVMAPETDEPQPTALVGGHVVIYDGMRTRTLPLLSDAVAITGHCALRAQGSVVCWDDDAPTAVAL